MSTGPHPESFPGFIEPMLRSSGPLPTAGGYCYEVKWDGMRLIAASNGTVRLRSRTGRDWTDEFPELQEMAAALANRRAVLDGELVCLGEDGKPDFGRLRTRLSVRRPAARPAASRAAQRRRDAGGARVRLVVFDLLHLDGWAVRELPYRTRRELLAELALDGPAWMTPRTFADGAALARVVAEHGLEGVVAKRLDRPYLPGRRSTAWVKHKHRRSDVFIVTGVAPARDNRAEELLVARVDEEGRLKPAGRVSYGLSGAERAELAAALGELRLPGRSRRGAVQWVLPRVVVEVDFHGSGKLLRDPILRGWRPPERQCPELIRPGP